MSNQRQIRGDTATNLAASVPAAKELAVNTTDNRLNVGDGATAGGIPHANYRDVIKNVFRYATAGGTANALTLALPFAPLSYAAGMKVMFKAASANTDVVTLNVNGLGAKNVYKLSGGTAVALDAGDIVSGVPYEAMYDGTQFLIWPNDWAGAGGGGGLVFLGRATAATSSVLIFNSSIITSDYDNYRVVANELVSSGSTTSIHLYMYASADGGTSNLTSTPLVDAYTSGSGVCHTSFSVDVYNVNSTTGGKICGGIGGEGKSGPVSVMSVLSSAISSTSVVSGLRILYSSGNIVSGTVDVYGYKKS